MHEIDVTGFWSLNNSEDADRIHTKIEIPKDLTESVGIHEVHTDNLSGFEENVLKLVEKDEKVLIIKTCFNDLIEKVFETWNPKLISPQACQVENCGVCFVSVDSTTPLLHFIPK